MDLLVVLGKHIHKWCFLLASIYVLVDCTDEYGWKKAHCQGRFVRCGETKSHDPVSGLYRRCEMSSSSWPLIFDR